MRPYKQMDVFGEKDKVNLRLSAFKDEKLAPLSVGQISALWYRVDEVASGTNQVAQTNLTPAEPTDIAVLPAQNVMIDSAKPYESVLVTVHFEWGPNTGKTKAFLYRRNNQKFFP